MLGPRWRPCCSAQWQTSLRPRCHLLQRRGATEDGPAPPADLYATNGHARNVPVTARRCPRLRCCAASAPTIPVRWAIIYSPSAHLSTPHHPRRSCAPPTAHVTITRTRLTLRSLASLAPFLRFLVVLCFASAPSSISVHLTYCPPHIGTSLPAAPAPLHDTSFSPTTPLPPQPHPTQPPLLLLLLLLLLL